MSSSPFFSIIIPTYNSDRTIHASIESVLNQNFCDLEILIIDGMSLDKTLDIVKAFNDFRVKIFRDKDIGIYDAMNKGIKLSKGKWLYFLGSDDYFDSDDILDKITDIITSEELDVVYGNVKSNYLGGIYDGEFDEIKIYMKNICHQSIFFKRDVFIRTGYFDLDFKVLADWDHNLKWFFNKMIKRKYVDLVIAEYMDGGYSSKTHDKSFSYLKNWRYRTAQKYNYSLLEKLNLFFNQCLSLYRIRRRRDLVKVILEFPRFMLR